MKRVCWRAWFSAVPAVFRVTVHLQGEGTEVAPYSNLFKGNEQLILLPTIPHFFWKEPKSVAIYPVIP